MNRGARREAVFPDDQSREIFLELLADLPTRFSVRVHGYALMPNHYHLMLESVRGVLPRAMRHLGGEYSRRINTTYHWDGPLFRGRYRNRLVSTEEYWRYLLLYLHANPVRAGLSEPAEAAWTSHQAYQDEGDRPEWLRTDEILRLFGSRARYAQAWQEMADGDSKPPPGFSPENLWRPETTGAVTGVEIPDTTFDVADALKAVTRVTGVSLDDLVGPPGRGRRHPAKWLAAWWMSRRCGIPHGGIADAFGIGHDAVSRNIRRVEQRRESDERFRDWIAQLQKVSSVNT